MHKEYLLRGLGCANCANKIERAVGGLDGVSSATVNFLNTTLSVDIEARIAATITDAVKKIVNKYEPDVAVVDKQVKIVRAASLSKSTASKSGSSACCSGHAYEDEHHSHAHTDVHAHTDGHVHGHANGHVHRADCSHSHDANESAEKLALFSIFRNKTERLVLGAIIFAMGMAAEFLIENPFIPATLLIISYAILGTEVVYKAIRNASRGQLFDEHFLMSVATIGAFILGQLSEAAAVMLFYQVGEYFQEKAVRKSKRSITELMDIRPDSANILKDGKTINVSPETVRPGDIIVVSPGEKIPLDGVIASGESYLDQKALTGESAPRAVSTGDTVLSGCVNQSGLLRVKVTKSYGESTVSKIIDLVENATSKKAPTEHFITTFSRYYTPAVVLLAACIALGGPLLFGGSFSEWVNRGLICLVISCPCALVISIPLGFFGGIGGASRLGVLVKGGNYLEALNKLDMVVFDKTGTLTNGVFEVTGIYPSKGFNDEELLEYAAYAEAYSNHPIAASIKKAYGQGPDKRLIENYKEIAGHGVSVTANGKKLLAGNSKLLISENISFTSIKDSVFTTLYVAVDNVFAGTITIADTIKEDSRGLCAALKKRGIRKTVMLTGDNAAIAEVIAKELDIDEVHAELLPAQKVEQIEALEKLKIPGKKLAVIGDGINDAPVLARADIGIAMGGLGSDAAIEAADVVLMTDEPSRLLNALGVAAKTHRIVWQNIIFALGVKAIFLTLGAFGMATMWEAVFADVGVSVLAILNSMRALNVKKYL